MPRFLTIEPKASREPPPAGQVPYDVGEFVEVAGRLGNEITIYIVEIISLWTSPYLGFTGRYYYTPRDLGEKIMAQFPSSVNPNNITSPEASEVIKCEELEIFQSTYTGDNHIAAIVRKCYVLSRTQFHHTLVHNPEETSSYLCRYAFHAWKFPSPFTKIITDDERASVRLGDECQADVPPFDPSIKESKEIQKEKSFRKWQPSKIPDMDSLDDYLQLIDCIQLAVGNLVYAWHEKAKEQILSVLEEYKGDQTYYVVYLDGSGSLTLPCTSLRGLVASDEALMILHDAGYSIRIAVDQVTQLISVRSAAAVKFMRETQTEDETSDSSVGSSTSSPRSFKRQCKQAPSSASKGKKRQTT